VFSRLLSWVRKTIFKRIRDIEFPKVGRGWGEIWKAKNKGLTVTG
jgi:hypothetical protein